MDVIEILSGSNVVEVIETSSTVIEILAGAKGDPGPSGAGITVNGISPDGTSNITLTKSSIGLANVDNTSDANKPISSATATALAGKAATSHSHAAADVTSGVFSTARLGTGSPGTTNYLRGDGAWTVPTKADVGLSNVDNTSDANKPVSSATQTALNLKANLASPTFTGTVSGITAAMVGASATGHTHAAADIASGVIATARLGTGTADSTTYLRGDGTWATVAGGGGGATALSGLSDVALTGAATGEVLRYNGTAWTDAALTKSDVGLANVDNTSDANKPVSTATSSALALKADDNNVMHLSLNESITGYKTFTGGTFHGATMTFQDAINIAAGTTTGTKIGTATTQKLGFFNATPVVQQGNTVELSAVLANLGLRASGSAMPFTSSGAITFSGVTNVTGPIRFGITTVTANAAPNLTTSNHQYLIDATSNAVALTLPATTTSGHRILAKRIDSVTANAVTVVGTLIDGFGTTYTLPAQWDYVELVSTTTSGTWRVVGASRVGTHVHAATDITSGVLNIAQIPTGTTGTTVALGNHSHTKTDIGLGNVDNTSDANKPLSTADVTALAGKVSTTASETIAGTKTFSNAAIMNSGGQALQIAPGSVDHAYLAFFARTSTPSTRSGYLGYTSAASTTLILANEITGGGISLNAGTGTLSLNGGTVAVGGNETVSGTLNVTGVITGPGSGITALNATNLASGTVPTARLGSGTASATTYLRGDGTWATPAGGGSSTLAGLTDVTIASPALFQVLQHDGTKWFNGSLDIHLRGTDQNIFYNTGSSTYPVRTSATYDTARRARWIGPVAPTIGGSYAIADFDIWEKTA